MDRKDMICLVSMAKEPETEKNLLAHLALCHNKTTVN